jgi:hypothetical protein
MRQAFIILGEIRRKFVLSEPEHSGPTTNWTMLRYQQLLPNQDTTTPMPGKQKKDSSWLLSSPRSDSSAKLHSNPSTDNCNLAVQKPQVA